MLLNRKRLLYGYSVEWRMYMLINTGSSDCSGSQTTVTTESMCHLLSPRCAVRPAPHSFHMRPIALRPKEVGSSSLLLWSLVALFFVPVAVAVSVAVIATVTTLLRTVKARNAVFRIAAHKVGYFQTCDFSTFTSSKRKSPKSSGNSPFSLARGFH